MSWLAALGLTLLFVGFLGIANCRLRRPMAMVLLATSAWAGYLAFAAQGSTRHLRVTTQHAAFVENDLGSKTFTIEDVTAPGPQWAVLAAASAMLLASVLFAAGRRTLPAATTASLYAWAGFALVLGFEKSAAPAELVGWPAIEACAGFGTLVFAVLCARPGLRPLAFFARMIVFASAVRVPIALFGTWATQHQKGTHLDVHRIDFIANPITQTSLDVVPGSAEQLAWLIWVPQLVVHPVFTFFVAGGIGFAILMFLQHPPARRAGA